MSMTHHEWAWSWHELTCQLPRPYLKHGTRWSLNSGLSPMRVNHLNYEDSDSFVNLTMRSTSQTQEQEKLHTPPHNVHVSRPTTTTTILMIIFCIETQSQWPQFQAVDGPLPSILEYRQRLLNKAEAEKDTFILMVHSFFIPKTIQRRKLTFKSSFDTISSMMDSMF